MLPVPRLSRPVAAAAATGAAVVGLVLGGYAVAGSPQQAVRGSATLPAGAFAGATPEPMTAPDSEPVSGPTVAPAAPGVGTLGALARRLPADVLVTTTTSMPAATLRKLAALTSPRSSTVLRVGTVRVGTSQVRTLGVDPGSFRSFTPRGTAEATAVWQAVARGEAVADHLTGNRLQLSLGTDVPVSRTSSGPSQSLRLGALATTNLPGSDLVVADGVAATLGLPAATGVVLSAEGRDPAALAEAVRRVAGNEARIDLLSPPAANPVAFLTGSRAADAFGAFSYRYFPDGTIAPDAKWVDDNIRTESVPILGRVTCHRLMLPQLRGALEEISAAGLSAAIHPGEYGGCYVPRFIESNPERPISLHTWGIAVDLNVPGNLRGTVGAIDRQVVAIFQRWGFRWGGDWAYTDPMHFELGALLK